MKCDYCDNGKVKVLKSDLEKTKFEEEPCDECGGTGENKNESN